MLAAYSNVKHNPNDYVPVLNVGCSISSGLDYFTHILVECKEKIPELHPYLQVMSHKRLFSQITQNYIDVAFGFQESLPRASNITYHHLFFVNVCCVVSTENPLSERTSVKMDDLYSTKVIVCSVDELPVSIRNMHRHLEYLYAPPNLYYCNDLSSTLTYVRADVGYSILPDLRSYRYRDIKCIPIEGFEPLSYGYYCKSDRESETYIRQFTRILPQPSV
jgi:DNA-binding transcriptional LysR family regulator